MSFGLDPQVMPMPTMFTPAVWAAFQDGTAFSTSMTFEGGPCDP